MERLGGVFRRAWSGILHLFFRVSRGLTIGVRAVVRTDDGKFLLVRHTYFPGWHFPGGGVEAGQTIEEALAQELSQETGLELRGKPKLHGVFFNRMVSSHDHVLVYQCEVVGELIANLPDPEIAEAAYFQFDSLPESIDAGTRRRLQEIVNGRTIGGEW